MNMPTLRRSVFLFLTGLVGTLLTAYPLAAQNSFIAYNVPAGAVGNQAIDGLVVGNDFRVVRPITVSQLGVFDSGTNGIQGSTVLTIQLYERSGRHAGTLLETLTFDAVNPGAGGRQFVQAAAQAADVVARQLHDRGLRV